MAKKIAMATVQHFAKTAECKKLTKAQLEALHTLSYEQGRPRSERLITSLPYQYQTLEALSKHRAVKFRCRNLDTGRFEYVCITEFGQQITLLHERISSEAMVLEIVYAKADSLLTGLKRGMNYLGVPLPKKGDA